MQVGWGIIACIIAGQMFSAINGQGLTIAVGCVITAVCVGLISIFGIAVVHRYERYALKNAVGRMDLLTYVYLDTLLYHKFLLSSFSSALLVETLTPQPSLLVLQVLSPRIAVPSLPCNLLVQSDLVQSALTSLSTIPLQLLSGSLSPRLGPAYGFRIYCATWWALASRLALSISQLGVMPIVFHQARSFSPVTTDWGDLVAFALLFSLLARSPTWPLVLTLRR